jgi:serine/threonine protein kinase
MQYTRFETMFYNDRNRTQPSNQFRPGKTSTRASQGMKESSMVVVRRWASHVCKSIVETIKDDACKSVSCQYARDHKIHVLPASKHDSLTSTLDYRHSIDQSEDLQQSEERQTKELQQSEERQTEARKTEELQQSEERLPQSEARQTEQLQQSEERLPQSEARQPAVQKQCSENVVRTPDENVLTVGQPIQGLEPGSAFGVGFDEQFHQHQQAQHQQPQRRQEARRQQQPQRRQQPQGLGRPRAYSRQIQQATAQMAQCCAPQEQLRYTLQREIGQGSFGTVYVAWDHLASQQVAIKVCKTWGDARMLSDIWKELEVLAMLRERAHAHTVVFHRMLLPHPSFGPSKAETAGVPSAIYYSMKYYTSGTLYDLIKRRRKVFKISEVRTVISGVLRGLQHVHERLHVVHRDLSPKNIMIASESATGLDQPGPQIANTLQKVEVEHNTGHHDEPADIHIHISDFGSSKPASSHQQGRAPALVHVHRAQSSMYYVTRYYRPPEMWCDLQAENPGAYYAMYTDRGDIWSVGCLMAEMLLGAEPIFKGDGMNTFCLRACALLGVPPADAISSYNSSIFRQMLTRSARKKQHGDEGVGGCGHAETLYDQLSAAAGKDAADSVLSMLHWLPSERPSAQEILRQPFFGAEIMPSFKDRAPGKEDVFHAHLARTLHNARIAIATTLNDIDACGGTVAASATSPALSASSPVTERKLAALARATFLSLLSTEEYLKRFNALQRTASRPLSRV